MQLLTHLTPSILSDTGATRPAGANCSMILTGRLYGVSHELLMSYHNPASFPIAPADNKGLAKAFFTKFSGSAVFVDTCTAEVIIEIARDR